VEKALEATPKAAKVAAVAKEAAVTKESIAAVVAKEALDATPNLKVATKKAVTVTRTSGFSSGRSDVAQADVEKVPNVTPDPKTTPKWAMMAMGSGGSGPLLSDSAPPSPTRAYGMSYNLQVSFSSSFVRVY
jgi:hypothetical protein